MNTSFKHLRRLAGAALAALLVASGGASAAPNATPQPLRAMILRGEAMNRLYGNAWTPVPPAEFRALIRAYSPDVTRTMTPQQARVELARGQGLNRLAEQYATATSYASTPSAAGFDWGDAGIGVATAFGAMVLAAAGAIGFRKRGRFVLHT